jgi:hypothetical protein
MPKFSQTSTSQTAGAPEHGRPFCNSPWGDQNAMITNAEPEMPAR